MFKKIKLENVPMDDSQLDTELNFPEDDFDIPEPADDRSPVKKILDSAVQQTKSTVASQGFIGKFLREALPKSYGEVYDTASEISQGTKELYNSAVAQIKPSMNELAKAADKLVPATKKRTKSALDRIKAWSKKDDVFSPQNEKEIQEKNIALELGDVFKFQMEEAQKEKAEDNAEKRVQESLSILRHKQQYRSLSSMDVNIARLTKYQEKVTAAFQRKTLELQYRSYYLGLESLKEARTSNEIFKTNLQGIVKNTALPEFVKIKNSERFKEVARTKLMEHLTTSTTNFIRKAFGNITQMGKGAIDSVRTGLETGAQMADGAAMVGDIGDKKKTFAETATEFGVDYALQNQAEQFGRKARDKVSQIEPIAKVGEWFRKIMFNAPAMLKDFADGGTDEDGKVVGIGRQLVGSAIGGIGPNMSIETDNLNSATEPGIFTKQTNKSITEIIPGFLARIFRELQILRTGDEGISLTGYDYFSNKFTSTKAIVSKIKDKLINKSNAEWKDTKSKEILTAIDPENKLSPEAGKALMDKLVREGADPTKSFSRERLTTVAEYEKNPELTGVAQEIANLFEKYFTKDGTLTDKSKSAYMKRSNDFTAKVKGISEGIANPAQDVQKLINLGLYDEVRQTGLFQDSGANQLSQEAYKAIKDSEELTKLLKAGAYKKVVSLLKAKDIDVTIEQLKPKDETPNLSIGKILDAHTASYKEEAEDHVVTTGKSENILNRRQKRKQRRERELEQSRDSQSIVHNAEIEQVVAANPQIAEQCKCIDPALITQLLDEAKKINSSIAGVLTRNPNDNANIIEALKSDEKFKPLENIALKIQQATESTNVSLKTIIEKIETLTEQLHITANTTEDSARKGYRKDTLFSNLMGLAGKGFAGVKKVGSLAAKAGDVAFNLSRGTAKIGGKVTGATIRTAANILITKRDVYVEGEIEPRLSAVGFKQGIYTDSVTGKVLKSIQDLKDLKGNVLENGINTVLYLEEVPKTFVKAHDTALGSIFNIGKWIGNKMSSFVVAGTKGSFSLIRGTFNLTKSTYKAFANILDRPVDIYIKDKLDKPVLLAMVMRNGGYFSATTGKPITKPSEIDGAIKDKDGNFVLTIENLKEGIVDINNNKITTAGGKIMRAILGVAGLGIRTVLKTGVAIGKAVMKGTGLGFDFMKGIAGSLKDAFNFGMGGKKSNEVLVQIRDILDSRLPGGKRIFGDKDGDGDRDGGWQDLFQNKDKNKDKDEKDERINSTIKPDRKNTIDKMLDGLSTIKDKIAGLFGLGGEGGGPGIDINLPDGDGGRNRRGRGPRGRGKGGFLRRAGGKLLNAGKAVGGFALNNAGTLLKGAAGVGAVYSGVEAVKSLSEGNYGDAAVSGGLSILGGSAATGTLGTLGSGLLTAGGTALSAGAAVATGLGTVLATPVVLGSAAALAAGYGAYRLFKAFRKLGPFEKLRMAQYGFSKDANSVRASRSYIDLVQQFEQILIKQVKYSEDGKAEITDKDIDIKEVESIFGLDLQSKERDEIIKVRNWRDWYISRFKPVFLTHLTALNKLDKKHTFESIEDEKDSDIKRKYLDMAKFPEGPYSFLVSPFENLSKLETQKTSVTFYVDELYKQLDKEKEEAGKKTLFQAFKEGTLGDEIKSRFDKATENLNPAKMFTDMKEKISNLTLKDIASAIPGGAIVYAAVSMVGTKIQKSLGFGVDALEAIRFKAYGLKEMDRSKVLSLRSLEQEIDKGITYLSDNTAVWKGSIPELIKNIGSDFGINVSDGLKTENWTRWFSLRFIPVFTAYCGELRARTGKGERDKAEIGLKPQDAFDIGKALIGVPNVWGVSISPWIDYELNSLSSTTDGNLKILEDKAKDAKLREEKAEKKKAETQDKASGKEVKKAVEKLSTDKKTNYSDARSEKAVKDDKIDSVMRANFGPAWKTTLSEQDQKDAIATIENGVLAKSGASSAGVPRVSGTPNATPALTGSTDPVNAVKDAVPGNSKAKRSNFNGFGTDVDTYIHEAANKYGISEDVLRGFVKMEGGWTGKMSPTGAIGTGQFIQSTWNALARSKEGQEIGMTVIDSSNFRKDNDPRRDKRINTLATGLLAKQNAAMLTKAGLPVSGENLYMVHNVGPGVIQTIKTGQASPETLKAMGYNGLGTHSTDATGFVKKQKEIFNQHYASANSVPRQVDTKILDEKGQWNDYKDKSKLPDTEAPKTQQADGGNSPTHAPKTQSNPVQTEKPKQDQPQYTAQVADKGSVVKTALAETKSPSMIKTAGSYGGSVNAVKPGAAVDTNRTYVPPLSIAKTPDMLNFGTKATAGPQDTARELREIINPVGVSIKESVTIQRDMLTVLREIASKVTPNGNQQSQQAQPQQQPEMSDTSIKRGSPDRRLPEVPVSMAKTKYAI